MRDLLLAICMLIPVAGVAHASDATAPDSRQCESAPCSAHVDLDALDRDMSGPRAQVLVLGSVHLSQLPEGTDFDPATLQPLLQRLAAYKPDVITIEALSGEPAT